MKIKITNPARKWPVECGRTYHARPALPREDGQKVYFVHVAGDWFGISEKECEEIREDNEK